MDETLELRKQNILSKLDLGIPITKDELGLLIDVSPKTISNNLSKRHTGCTVSKGRVLFTLEDVQEYMSGRRRKSMRELRQEVRGDMKRKKLR